MTILAAALARRGMECAATRMGELPDERAHVESGWSSEPMQCTAWGGDGWIVVAVLHGVRGVLYLLPVLSERRSG